MNVRPDYERLAGPLRKTLVFVDFLYNGIPAATRRQPTGNAPAPRQQPGGKDNSAPAEDLHNKNPSLVALGKKALLCKPEGVGKTDTKQEGHPSKRTCRKNKYLYDYECAADTPNVRPKFSDFPFFRISCFCLNFWIPQNFPNVPLFPVFMFFWESSVPPKFADFLFWVDFKYDFDMFLYDFVRFLFDFDCFWFGFECGFFCNCECGH